MSNKFSIDQAIAFGWKTTLKNIGFFVVILLIFGAIIGIPSIFIEGMRESQGPSLTTSILDFILKLVQLYLGLGMLRIALNFVDGKKSEIKDLFPSKTNEIINYIVAAFIVGFIVILGLILLIIPGIILGLKLQFFGYSIVDKGLGIIEAIKRSWKITEGQLLSLFVLGLVLLVINILGALALLVGLFLTIPTSMLAVAYVYRKLA